MQGQLIQRSKERFKKLLAKRFSLRLHMFLILSGVFCAGLLSSKLLLELHVHNMLIRYPLAVLCSYVAFFGLVKLWLFYLGTVTDRRSRSLESISGDGSSTLPDLAINIGGADDSGTSFFSGGRSGGGGASASFDSAPGETSQFIVASDTSSGSLTDGAGSAVSAIFDGEDTWILIVLGIVLAIICGTGVYLIYQAPMILSDAAFQAILSTSLLKQMKKMTEPDWIGSVLRATAFPFLIVLAAATTAAWAANHVCPQAEKMSEVIAHILAS